MEMIRVVIADDHPVFRYGLRALLSTEPGTEVVAGHNGSRGHCTGNDAAARHSPHGSEHAGSERH